PEGRGGTGRPSDVMRYMSTSPPRPSRVGVGRAQRAFAAGTDEGDDLLHRRLVELLLHIVEALHQRTLVGEQQAVGAAQGVDVVAREAEPLRADDVEARA